MNFRPLHDNLLVKRLAEEEKWPGPGGAVIIVPDAAKKQSTFARVLAVGPGRILKDGTRTPVNVSPGAVVVLEELAGSDVVLDGETYTVVEEDEVLAMEVGAQVGVTRGGAPIYVPSTRGRVVVLLVAECSDCKYQIAVEVVLGQGERAIRWAFGKQIGDHAAETKHQVTPVREYPQNGVGTDGKPTFPFQMATPDIG